MPLIICMTKTQHFSITLPNELAETIKKSTKQNGQTVSGIIRIALEKQARR